jgi:hypothetical protein
MLALQSGRHSEERLNICLENNYSWMLRRVLNVNFYRELESSPLSLV